MKFEEKEILEVYKNYWTTYFTRGDGQGKTTNENPQTGPKGNVRDSNLAQVVVKPDASE